MKLKNKSKKKKRISNFLYDFVKVTGAIPALIWFRLRVLRLNENVPKRIKGGVLIASNHVTFFDPIIVHLAFWYRRLFSLATKDLYSNKIREMFFNVAHCIKLDKNNFNVGSLHAVCDRLKEDKAVLIFPEGSVNRQEDVKSYKSGAILMAHLSKKPILPIYIHRAEKWYNRTTVVIGEPIDVNALCGKIPTQEQMEKASQVLRDKEIEMQEFCIKKLKKER